jgi:hypothetical protein
MLGVGNRYRPTGSPPRARRRRSPQWSGGPSSGRVARRPAAVQAGHAGWWRVEPTCRCRRRTCGAASVVRPIEPGAASSARPRSRLRWLPGAARQAHRLLRARQAGGACTPGATRPAPAQRAAVGTRCMRLVSGLVLPWRASPAKADNARARSARSRAWQTPAATGDRQRRRPAAGAGRWRWRPSPDIPHVPRTPRTSTNSRWAPRSPADIGTPRQDSGHHRRRTAR